MKPSKVRFIHVLLAGTTMVGMAIVATLAGHTTAALAVQDVISVIGMLVLTVAFTTFSRK